MKTLLLLRGAPGCGKSTFIEQNGLKPYALSADDLRLLVRSPSQAVDGTDEIVFENEADVWNLLYKMLEIRMQSGEFTVIDATNSKTSEMNKYKEMCDMYRYRMFCIDFTDLPIEECKRRNASRPKIKQVPEDAINKMYARFRTQKIPSGIKVLKPDQLDSVWMHKFDMSKYEKIVHIGDDHGCMAPLSRYIRTSYFGFDYDEPNYWKSQRWLNIEDLPGEIWKDIDGYCGQYLISNYGRLKTFSKLKERICVYRQYGDRYLYANLSLHSKKKTYKAHKLVWDAFGDGSCDEINHIDGVCQNNNIKNLERSDRISNETHCWESGIKHGRHIIQFDLDHNKIKEYDSVKQAVNENGFSSGSGIIHCCNGDYEQAFGYIWKYADDISGNRSGKSVCVLQYTPDGEFVAEYPSIKAAEKAVGVQSIRNCLAGNQRTSGGFVWKTKDYTYEVKKTNPILYDPKYLTSLMNDNYFYIFVGDYTDRGIENADVIKFIMDAVERPNVLCLTGNHECYHKDTEVLTDRGWKNISEVDANSDMVAQFNINTGVITFAHPSGTVQNFAESMVDIESFNMHQIVTPNHEVVYKYQKIKAKELLKETNLAQHDFPVCGNVDNIDYSISDDDLRFIVWIVSDATIVRQEDSIKTRIQFHMSRQDKIKNLTDLMDKIGIKYTLNKCKDVPNRSPQYMICVYGDFARKYDSLLNHKKAYPEFFTCLSKRQMFIVLEEITKTDGHRTSNIKIEMSTVSKENADIIQTMCITHGAACTIKEKDNSCGFNKNGVIYTLSIKPNGLYSSYDVQVREIPYNDFVYCVTMPEGTVVTRYNGKVAFSGNCWTWLYAHDCVGKSKEFEFFTRKQLDEAQIDKKKIRKMMRKFGQAAWYTYGYKEILVTHAGIATMPDNLTLMATKQFVHGVGGYKDSEAIAKTWIETTPDNMYQIHGHRNIKDAPMKVNDRVYNLEGKVEFGGHLRILELDANGFHEIEIKNNVFCPPIEVEQHKEIADSPISDVVMKLRQNKYIQEKEFGHISSFNFTNSAFYDKVWDAQTVQARGLYIDTERMKVAARAYEKFFSINERPETKFEMLQHKFQFPVTCYVKENGFLGLISYDIGTDDLFITTKSTPEGPYAKWFREMFERKVSAENREKIKNYCKEYDVTFVFECVDLEHDPHVIDYPESNLYLLSIVKNALNFEQVSYANLCLIAEDFGLNAKTLGYEIANWSDFVDWYNMVMDKDYEFNGRIIEGFVIEDSAGFMTKCKLTYYNFWKFMRGIAHETLRRGYIPPAKTSALTTDTANKFYGFCKLLYAETPKEERDNIPKDIVTLRKMFYAGYRDLY